MFNCVTGLFVGLACIGVAREARAITPEEMAEILFDPSDPCHLVLRYVEAADGLLLSNDGGRTLRMRCGSSLDAEGTDASDLVGRGFVAGFGADGVPLVGSFAGLSEASPEGCGWGLNPDPLVAARVVDFTTHPSDATRTYILVTSTSDGERTGIVERDSSGALTAVGASDTGEDGSSTFRASRLRLVAKADAAGGVRYYETGLKGEASIVRYSDDGAETWTEHEVTEAAMGTLLLWAVDPTDPNRILLSVHDPEYYDQVLVSDDAGETVRPFSEDMIPEVSGVAVAENGELWLGGASLSALPGAPAGLWHAASLGDAPEKLSETPMHCLGLRPQDETLFGCTRDEVGHVDKATGEFTRTSSLHHTAGFVECPGEDLAMRCESQLCSGYCGSGSGHYPESPLCEAYSDPSCGPDAGQFWGGPTEPEALAHVVDPMCPHELDDAVSTTDAGATTGGSDASMPTGSSQDDAGGGSNGGSSTGNSGTTGTDGTATTETSSSGGGGGCSSTGGAPRAWLFLLAALFTLPWWRRSARL